MKNLINYIGIEEDRVNFAWISASEGGRFAELVNELTEKVKKLGPNKNIVNKHCEV
ncbi:hypothetical protein Pmgp_03621 [Pelotomaculum propionicicum]|uniref:F420-non-reducing hydrogenase iron-sulfur subunit D domain-containing protein n=1 Tax=Pelotomaculum propionicicum TaxID=258475 RepID=A0A4Y7RKF0_9FIRM|nr:hypothetical protein Pmgp_03621 [Pelotomaculum propionicicum]